MLVARVVIFLVSQNFLVSEFVRNEELPELLQAAKYEHATILWIPISPSRVEDAKIMCKDGTKLCIADYQAICDPVIPLQDMSKTEREKIYNKICERIKCCFGVVDS